CCGRVFAQFAPPTLYRLDSVFGEGAGLKMSRIDAARSVAKMQNQLSIRDGATVVQFPGKPMGKIFSLRAANVPVAIIIDISEPQNTSGVRLRNTHAFKQSERRSIPGCTPFAGDGAIFAMSLTQHGCVSAHHGSAKIARLG